MMGLQPLMSRPHGAGCSPARRLAGVAAALTVVATCAHAQCPGFSRDLAQATADARATGKLVLIYFTLPGCPHCRKAETDCLTKPAFRLVSAVFNLVELDAKADKRLVDSYQVETFPNFAVLDGAGKLKAPPGPYIATVIAQKTPQEASAALLSLYQRLYTEDRTAPASAEPNITVLEFLKAYDQATEAEAWLARALANPRARPGDIACLKVYQALALRRGGKPAAGLKLVQETFPALGFREAPPVAGPAAPALAPVVVSRGEITYGIMPPTVDPRLAWQALDWLSALTGAVPAPAGLDEGALAIGAIALGVVLGREAEAAPWLEAYRAAAGGQGFRKRPAAVLVDGIIMRAQGRASEAASRLIGLVKYAPAESFSPLAGVLACEAAQAAGEADNASRCARLVRETYGALLPADLQARLPAA